MRSWVLPTLAVVVAVALPAALYAIGDRASIRRPVTVLSVGADASGDDAAADAAAPDAACCDASLEGYLSVEAVGFEAVGY